MPVTSMFSKLSMCSDQPINHPFVHAYGALFGHDDTLPDHFGVVSNVVNSKDSKLAEGPSKTPSEVQPQFSGSASGQPLSTTWAYFRLAFDKLSPVKLNSRITEYDKSTSGPIKMYFSTELIVFLFPPPVIVFFTHAHPSGVP